MRSNVRKQSSLSSLHSKERHLLGGHQELGAGKTASGKVLAVNI